MSKITADDCGDCFYLYIDNDEYIIDPKQITLLDNENAISITMTDGTTVTVYYEDIVDSFTGEKDWSDELWDCR